MLLNVNTQFLKHLLGAQSKHGIGVEKGALLCKKVFCNANKHGMGMLV